MHANSPIPPEIQVEELMPHGVRYELPRRELGKLHYLGLVPIAIGLLMGFGMFLFGIGFGLMGIIMLLPFAFGLLVPVVLGCFVLWGRSEIVLDRGKLTNIERAGPLRWSSSRPVEQLQELNVAGKPGAPATVPPSDLTDVAALSAILGSFDLPGNKRRLVMAPAYPKQWLQPIADDLARRLNVTVTQSPMSGSADDDWSSNLKPYLPESQDASMELPLGSDIEVETAEGSLTLKVPPAGIRGSKHGFFTFGVIWCLFVGAFTVAMYFSKEDVPWVALAVMVLFWAVGLGMLAAGWNFARRRTMLAVVDDRLLVLQTGPFKTRREEWTRNDIASIHVGASGMEVNKVPIQELQIKPARGKKFGILSERPDGELKWIAGQLCRALRVGPHGSHIVEQLSDEELQQPPEESKLQLERYPTGLTIQVPPRGLWRGGGALLIMGLVWTAIVLGVMVALINGMARGSLIPWFIEVISLLVGLTMLLIAVHLGTRRGVISLVGDELLAMKTGIFGTSQRQWSRVELHRVDVGGNGTVINGQPVMELKIRGTSGNEFGMCAGWPDEDLHWMKAVLNRQLGVEQREQVEA